MKYYLDCEFGDFRGELISLALVGEDGRELYLVTHRLPSVNLWVRNNVVPFIFAEGTNPIAWRVDLFGVQIAEFLRGDILPVIVADWPDDIRYFCECLITGPGEMVDIPGIRFDIQRVDAYPTTLPGAVQHNALWDARALRHAVGNAPRSGDLPQEKVQHPGAALQPADSSGVKTGGGK